MATLAPNPKPAFCADKRGLLEAFLEATRVLNNLQDAEVKAILESDSRLERIDLALQVARERREQAKLTFLFHVQAHGC